MPATSKVAPRHTPLVSHSGDTSHPTPQWNSMFADCASRPSHWHSTWRSTCILTPNRNHSSVTIQIVTKPSGKLASYHCTRGSTWTWSLTLKKSRGTTHSQSRVSGHQSNPPESQSQCQQNMRQSLKKQNQMIPARTSETIICNSSWRAWSRAMMRTQ